MLETKTGNFAIDTVDESEVAFFLRHFMRVIWDRTPVKPRENPDFVRQRRLRKFKIEKK